MEPRISIIDDDRAVREALQRMLRSYGFDSAVFASAEQFLGSDGPRRSACLILDVRMPGMTGIALHERLVADGCNVPTILVTARPSHGERERAMAMGAISYLTKPFDVDILLETVRDALQHGAAAGALGADRGAGSST